MKLYVNSKSRASGTHDADFAISLPRPLVIRGRQKAFIDSVILSNSFYTIRFNENDQIYLREDVSVFRIITIPEGQYQAFSLRDTILAQLQNGNTLGGNYTVDFSIVTQRLTINQTGLGTFHIYSGQLLKNNLSVWNDAATTAMGAAAPLITTLRSSDGVTGLVGDALLSGAGPNAGSTIPLVAIDAVNVQPYSQLFLRSSLADTTSVMTSNGGSDIIRRIVIGQTALNDLCFDAHSLGFDSIDLKDRELNSMEFSLTDSSNRIVNTRGHEISFSIIFVPVEE